MTQRFTSECELCAELLTDYISASNIIVDSEEQRTAPRPPSAGQLASAMLDRALERRNQARKRLLVHKKHQH